MVFDDVILAGGTSTTVETALAITQQNEVLQTIQIVLAILTFLTTLAYTIWKWYKKAKQDGKITKDEVEELIDNVKDVIDKKDE